MTTVQIVGIAVAAAVVLLLVVALLVTRRRGEPEETADADAPSSSFLDEAPQDTLSALGKPERPVEEVTVDPGVEREAAAAAAAGTATLQRSAENGGPEGLGLDWGPSGDDVRPEPAAAGAPAPPKVEEAKVAGEKPPAAPGPPPADEPITPSPSPEGGTHAPPEPARPADAGSAAPAAAPETGHGERMVPLSSIIVTTSRKLVDLQDPEVRRMLTDLVKFEIDQATLLSRQGQTIDAVLQLTEAEKISRALGMNESAAGIRDMIRGMQDAG